MKKLIKITLSILAIALILTLPALADGMELVSVTAGDVTYLRRALAGYDGFTLE